jgi:hypothetical protein
MNVQDLLILAIAAAVVVAGIGVFVRFPQARRWIGAALSVAIGFAVAVPFIAVGALQNMDTDGSLEPIPTAIGAACALLGLVIGVAIVIRRR